MRKIVSTLNSAPSRIRQQSPLESGFPETRARFARTHGQWDREAPVQLEDTLVAFADTIWIRSVLFTALRIDNS